MLRPFAHPVACCWMLLRVVAQSLKPVKLLAPCKRTQHRWELLRPFARSLIYLVCHPKFCITFFLNFSRIFQWSQQKMKTMHILPTTPNNMQQGMQTAQRVAIKRPFARGFMVDVQMANIGF